MRIEKASAIDCDLQKSHEEDDDRQVKEPRKTEGKPQEFVSNFGVSSFVVTTPREADKKLDDVFVRFP